MPEDNWLIGYLLSFGANVEVMEHVYLKEVLAEQCCGMPMGETNELYGTNADGSKSEDYCNYCFQNGEFTFQGQWKN